jgi:hypothetical protein
LGWIINNIMSRPKPSIVLTHTDPRTYKSEEVLAADAIYAVFHLDKPINLRTLNSLVSYPGPKYKKVSFSNPGHAFNLADRLNKMFKTEDFTVVELKQGRRINESGTSYKDI